MSVVMCGPDLTMKNTAEAMQFYDECKTILNQYVMDVKYISSQLFVQQALIKNCDENDIFIFFTAEDGEYDEQILKLIRKYCTTQSRIWAVAMEGNAKCRRPPEPVSDRQSFDVACRKENRNPLKNNMKAIAQIFARKIIAQILSPLYRDEVLYFISHRRQDGESLAAKLADQLKLLTRERNVYRDVVNVAVGDDAQKDIDRNLALSDVVIFLQTETAHESKYIMKELCFALISDIPVLWILIDDASYESMEIRPGDKPILRYRREEFEDFNRLIEIVDEIEEKCFQLIMNNSNQVFSYIECLNALKERNKIRMEIDKNEILAYEIEYQQKTRDLYDDGIRKHYIQCFGRNPKQEDLQSFIEKVKRTGTYDKNDKVILLSNHGQTEKTIDDKKICQGNYDDYIVNIQNMSGIKREKLNKRIIISGAFPESDEIYKNSLLEAVLIYSREIIRSGYTLVFGAHPSFQKPIFDMAALYSSDIKYSVEMHMEKRYAGEYNLDELQENCTLILSDGLQEMRKAMICKKSAEMLICLGGKIKSDKSQQGVDIEIELAKKMNIPVALVGTVGGRSSEYAYEILNQNRWLEINKWGTEINEKLYYSVNHRLMIRNLLSAVNRGSENE